MATETTLIFYEIVPSLKNITSSFIAIRLWKEKVLNGTFQEIFHRSPSQYVFNNSPRIPLVLVQLINQHISSVEKEIEKWATYNEYYVFKSCKTTFKVLKSYYDDVVWHPNGTIYDVRTARKMLLWPELTILNKLRVACLYCFKNDVLILRPFLSSDDIVAHKASDKSTLFSYWERYYEHVESNCVSESNYWERFLLDINWMANRWTVVEFFFNRATSFERLQLASNIIENRNSFYLKKLLGALKEEELRQVTSEHADEIMICFLMCPNSRLVARQFWAGMRDKMREEHFSKIICWMLEVEATTRVDEDFVNFFIDVWNRTPDRLKQ